MGWRENLRPASFRGVPFHMPSASGDGGRRLAIHEYFGMDDPYIEDLGGKARRFSIVGYVIGDDYMSKRDELLKACGQKGAGTLIHAWRGEFNVALESYTCAEKEDQGRYCEFSLSFVVAAPNVQPEAAADTQGATAAAANSAQATFLSVFGEALSVTSQPGFVADTLASQAMEAAGLMAGLPLGPSAIASDAAALTAARAAFASAGMAIVASALDMVGAGSLGSSLLSYVRLFGQASTDTGSATAGLRQLAAHGGDVMAEGTAAASVAATPARMAEASNTLGMGAYLRQVALAEQARVSANTTYDSYDAASARRSELVADLETAAIDAADSGDADGYAALRTLSRAVSADLTARGASLARIVPYQTGSSLPALVLAQRLYGDASRAGDLVSRNNVANPLFMPVSGSALAS